MVGSVTVRDLWEKKDLGKFSERFTAQVTTRRLQTIFLAGLRFHTERRLPQDVPPHGSMMLAVTPQQSRSEEL